MARSPECTPPWNQRSPIGAEEAKQVGILRYRIAWMSTPSSKGTSAQMLMIQEKSHGLDAQPVRAFGRVKRPREGRWHQQASVNSEECMVSGRSAKKVVSSGVMMLCRHRGLHSVVVEREQGSASVAHYALQK
jgi:hypothetical protein